MRRKLIAGNWKMNGTLASNKVLLNAMVEGLRGHDGADYAICVPFPYLFQAQAVLQGSNVTWGGQDLHQKESGAFTGSVPAGMLTEFGCKYVIVGHSERREYHKESDALIASKVEAAIKGGLIPILCVGETDAEHEAGQAQAVVGRQMDAVLDHIGVDNLAKAVIAYEPVWAIGTGKTATPEKAQGMHAFIRAHIAKRDAKVAAAIKILYGGSVKPANAPELLAQPDIDGALVGGVSLIADQFLEICREAN